MKSRWISHESLAVLEDPPDGPEDEFRTLTLTVIAEENHRNGYLALTATHPGTGEASFSEGGYVFLSDHDRRRLMFEPSRRDSRHLPILTPAARDRLVRLADLLQDETVLPPAVSAHRFSPHQVEQLLELREWEWDQRDVPPDVRQRLRESGS